eukprot:4381068-Amphidinium_carterae.1
METSTIVLPASRLRMQCLLDVSINQLNLHASVAPCVFLQQPFKVCRFSKLERCTNQTKML